MRGDRPHRAFRPRAQPIAHRRVKVPGGFIAERIATVPRARELRSRQRRPVRRDARQRDLHRARRQGTPGEPRRFATFDDRPVASVLLAADTLYAGGQFGVYRIPYRSGDRAAREKPQKIASLRPGGGAGHLTTTVVVERKGTLYASVGSSCNACDESDPTRATIQAMSPDGKNMRARAVDIRNAIALAVQPATGDYGRASPAATISSTAPVRDLRRRDGTRRNARLRLDECYDDRKPIGGASCANVVLPQSRVPRRTIRRSARHSIRPTRRRARVSGELSRRRVRDAARLLAPAAVPPRVAFVPFRGNTRKPRGLVEPRRAVDRVSSAAVRAPTARARAARPASRSAPTARCSSATIPPARFGESGRSSADEAAKREATVRTRGWSEWYDRCPNSREAILWKPRRSSLPSRASSI